MTNYYLKERNDILKYLTRHIGVAYYDVTKHGELILVIDDIAKKAIGVPLLEDAQTYLEPFIGESARRSHLENEDRRKANRERMAKSRLKRSESVPRYPHICLVEKTSQTGYNKPTIEVIHYHVTAKNVREALKRLKSLSNELKDARFRVLDSKLNSYTVDGKNNFKITVVKTALI